MKLKKYQRRALRLISLNLAMFIIILMLALISGLEKWGQFFAYLVPLELLILLAYVNFKLWQKAQKRWLWWQPESWRRQLTKYLSDPGGVEAELDWSLDRVLALAVLATVISFCLIYYWLPAYYLTTNY